MCFASFAGAVEDLRLATTTSVENSGLLDYLLPDLSGFVTVACGCCGRFRQGHETGERGDVDLMLTHAPPVEKKFIAAGYGVDRRVVMHNYLCLSVRPMTRRVLSAKTR